MQNQLKLKPLDEQVIVITGATSGHGLCTAQMAASRGATVMLAARDESALKQVCADIRSSPAERWIMSSPMFRLKRICSGWPIRRSSNSVALTAG